MRNTKKAERRKETQKRVSQRLTQRRGRGIEANIQGTKTLHRTEFHSMSIFPQARDAIQPERSISVVKCMVFKHFPIIMIIEQANGDGFINIKE